MCGMLSAFGCLGYVNYMNCKLSLLLFLSSYLIQKRKHTDRASLYKIQAALVVLVFDKGPLQPL